MGKILNRLKIIYYFLIKSIGFFPVLLSIVFTALALFILSLEEKGISGLLHNYIPFITVTNAETARVLLSTIVTGIISLTVFSFTMVMIVLNQASSNSSPRLIPGLISSRSHQTVLGFYIGTIIFSLIILINIKPKEDYLPALSVVIAIICTIISIGLFVYFIHSVSQSIQIGKIVESLYKKTLYEINQKITFQEKHSGTLPDVKDWHIMNSKDSGYLQSIDEDEIIKMAKENNTIIEFLIPLGYYVVKDSPLLRVSNSLKDKEDLVKKISNNLVFRQEEIVPINYIYGFKHLTETAIKALSPGINDPGTAIKIMNYLKELLERELYVSDYEFFYDDNDNIRIIVPLQNYKDTLFNYLHPIKFYGKRDVHIILHQIKTIEYLLKRVGEFSEKRKYLFEYLESLIEDADGIISNHLERENINSALSGIEKELNIKIKKI